MNYNGGYIEGYRDACCTVSCIVNTYASYISHPRANFLPHASVHLFHTAILPLGVCGLHGLEHRRLSRILPSVGWLLEMFERR